MLKDVNETLARLEHFDDTEYLANCIYDIGHDDEIELTGIQKYHLGEAVENLLGLHQICQDLAHIVRVEIHKKETIPAQITHEAPQTAPE